MMKADTVKKNKKGGKNSNKANHPLRHQTIKLCHAILQESPDTSALKLCDLVAEILENEHTELLSEFPAYQKHKDDGGGWFQPTFYRWCNEAKKAFEPEPVS